MRMAEWQRLEQGNYLGDDWHTPTGPNDTRAAALGRGIYTSPQSLMPALSTSSPFHGTVVTIRAGHTQFCLRTLLLGNTREWFHHRPGHTREDVWRVWRAGWHCYGICLCGNWQQQHILNRPTCNQSPCALKSSFHIQCHRRPQRLCTSCLADLRSFALLAVPTFVRWVCWEARGQHSQKSIRQR